VRLRVWPPLLFIEVPMELTLRTPRDFEWTPLGHS
jgi:hypothetical protein